LPSKPFRKPFSKPFPKSRSEGVPEARSPERLDVTACKETGLSRSRSRSHQAVPESRSRVPPYRDPDGNGSTSEEKNTYEIRA
jgi:hypothetical protein